MLLLKKAEHQREMKVGQVSGILKKIG